LYIYVIDVGLICYRSITASQYLLPVTVAQWWSSRLMIRRQ
jgi:hypothetical protein